MATISAAMVKDLREKTGAGMMDCKNALNETGGDLEGAVDWLRKKGLSKAAKKSGRVAAEGLVAVAVQGREGVVVEVNSETDFVARNDDFQKLVATVAQVALKNGAERAADVAAIGGEAYPGGGTVAEAVANAVATIGENMTLRRAGGLKVGQGAVAHYVHNAVGGTMGKIGVLVALESTGDVEALQAIGRQVAMHVAAANPLALDGAALDPAVVAREKQLLMDKNAGKPPHVIDKIVESGLKSYYKEATLLDQAFVYEPSKSVGQLLKELAGRIGAPVTLTGDGGAGGDAGRRRGRLRSAPAGCRGDRAHAPGRCSGSPAPA